MTSITRAVNVILTKMSIPRVIRSGELNFYCPSFTEMWRAETLFIKEPETIAWIDNFSPHSTLWDFGANVGTYTLYAAKNGHFVVAIEPSSREYEILGKNIALNPGLWIDAKKVFAGINTDHSEYPKPDYIKIDTDGHDIKILMGLEQSGVLKTVKEILIEVCPGSINTITEIMMRNDFALHSKGHSKMLDGTKYENYDNAIFRKRQV